MIHLQSETRQYCSLEAMEPVTSTSIWNPTVSQAITSPLYEIQVRLCNQVLSQEDYLVCSKDKREKGQKDFKEPDILQDPSTEQRYQMEPPEQGQNYSVNIPLTTDVSYPKRILMFLNSTFRCNMLVQQSTSPTQSSTRHPPLLQHPRKR